MTNFLLNYCSLIEFKSSSIIRIKLKRKQFFKNYIGKCNFLTFAFFSRRKKASKKYLLKDKNIK